MKKLVIIVAILSLTSIPAVGKQETTIVLEDGGKRVETIFEKTDNEYRFAKKASIFDKDGHKLRDESFLMENRYNDLGLSKVIKEYDRGSHLRLVELEFRVDVAVITGYEIIRLVLKENGVKSQMEIFYTDANPDNQIYSKSVSYYDKVGTKLFSRFYFTPAAKEQTGFIRLEEEYNSDGAPIKQRFLTDDGRYR